MPKTISSESIKRSTPAISRVVDDLSYVSTDDRPLRTCVASVSPPRISMDNPLPFIIFCVPSTTTILSDGRTVKSRAGKRLNNHLLHNQINPNSAFSLPRISSPCGDSAASKFPCLLYLSVNGTTCLCPALDHTHSGIVVWESNNFTQHSRWPNYPCNCHVASQRRRGEEEELQLDKLTECGKMERWISRTKRTHTHLTVCTLDQQHPNLIN